MAVVGGGLIGCAIARELARRGRRVVVLERGTLGGEASSAAAGMVAPQAEAEMPGPLLALGLESRRRYPAFVAAVQEESGVDVEYRTGGILYVAFTPAEVRRLARRARWQERLGLRVRELSPGAARRLCPALPRRLPLALHFPDDDRVNNERLVLAVGIAARRAGAVVREGSEVLAIEVRRGRVWGVRTAGGMVEASAVVNAAGAWAGTIGLPPSVSRPPVFPVRGQMVVLRAAPGSLGTPLYSQRAYLVPRVDGRILLGSTREHAGFDKSVMAGTAGALLGAAAELAPGLMTASVERVYAGLRPGTPDELPVLGAAPELPGLFHATGHYRSGILLAPLTAAAVADLVIAGRTALPIRGLRRLQRPSTWRSVASSPGVRKA